MKSWTSELCLKLTIVSRKVNESDSRISDELQFNYETGRTKRELNEE